MSPLSTEPGQDGADHDCGTIDNRELVVASRQSPPLLDVGERPLDDIAVLVRHGVECRRPPATAATLLPGCDLVPFLRNHRRDPASPQILTIMPGPISPVGQYRLRPRPGTASPNPWDPNISEDLRQYDSVVALTAGDHDRQRSAPTVNGVMDLRCQSASGASDAVAGGFTLPIGQILVTRCSPLCPGQGGTCSSRAGGHD